MLPLSDGLPARRFPVVNVTLIVANFIETNFGLFSATANGGSVAFFAHVGGFIFGLLAAWALTGAGQIAPREQ